MARTTGTTSLADLMAAGKLRAGDTLIIRRRSAPQIEATIERDGRIRVDSGVFASPSAAAKQALKARAVDGWLRWRVPRLGDCTLADVREGRS